MIRYIGGSWRKGTGEREKEKIGNGMNGKHAGVGRGVVAFSQWIDHCEIAKSGAGCSRAEEAST